MYQHFYSYRFLESTYFIFKSIIMKTEIFYLYKLIYLISMYSVYIIISNSSYIVEIGFKNTYTYIIIQVFCIYEFSCDII